MTDDKKSSSPFAKLAALRDALPAGPEATPREQPAPADPRSPFAGKIVVAHTRKGRGGKTVTTIEGVRGDARFRDDLARELKRALGCGAAVEGDRIVVQGEQLARVKSFLEARGARRVVLGT